MFSNKQNINILTSLLKAHGIEDAVVCPGSRNAPIVYNLQECKQIKCHPVTDERSAGFYALGIAQATQSPVVVCVTSGSALLNLAPAVAEASYQHVPLIVVSADRPQQWIDQLDGQTLPQPDALLPFVRKAVTLPEPHDDETQWYCNRLVNEALFQMTAHSNAPVHINVPISEPLFGFDTPELPEERVLQALRQPITLGANDDFLDEISKSQRPLVVIGHTAEDYINEFAMGSLTKVLTVFSESLSNGKGAVQHFDEVIRCSAYAEDNMPHIIIYVGGTLVSKPAREFLRRSKAKTYLLTTDASHIPDPTMHLAGVMECADEFGLNSALTDIAEVCHENTNKERKRFNAFWRNEFANAQRHIDSFTPPYSQMAAVKYLEGRIDKGNEDFHVHYANSTAIRLANIYAKHYVWCNRGVNGIEGSLSTAAGFSLGVEEKVICVIGDLSFFYDQNALWNINIKGNLRILLLNNLEGGIFRQLEGIPESPATKVYIAGHHATMAYGICQQHHIEYHLAENIEEMRDGIEHLLTTESEEPIVLEVRTNAEEDAAALQKYYSAFCGKVQNKKTKQQKNGNKRMEKD